MACLIADLPEPIREGVSYELKGVGPNGAFSGEVVVPAAPGNPGPGGHHPAGAAAGDPRVRSRSRSATGHWRSWEVCDRRCWLPTTTAAGGSRCRPTQKWT